MRRASTWLSTAAIVFVGLVICAWFALGTRQAHDTTRATAILSSGPPLSRSQVSEVSALLHSAALLNPDTTVTMLRAQLASELDRRQQASRLLLRVVHEEPMNAPAWEQLAGTTTNHTTYIQSLITIGNLVPRPGRG